MPRKYASSDERSLLTNLRKQLKECAGVDEDLIAKQRKQAWDYYFQRKRGDEIPGRSTVVSGDLSAMVEAVLSQMDEAFSGDNICEFEATSKEDEDQSRLESQIVARYVMGKNNGSMELLAAIKSILLMRNGVVKVWIQEKRNTITNTFADVSPEAFAEIVAPDPSREVTVNSYDPDSGELDLTVTTIAKALRVTCVPLASFHYPRDWTSLDLQECPIMAERHVETRQTLLDRGFPPGKVSELKPYTNNLNATRMAQAPGYETQWLKGLDASQDHIEWYEFHANTSRGRERICVDFNNNCVLERTPVDMVPYAAGACFINPNRFTGISLHDKLKSSQDINTGLNRALLDNVNTVNKNRVAYFDGIANPEDIGDGRTNGAIRVRQGIVQDVRQAVTAFTVPDVSSGILANIENQRQQRAEMGGASLTLATGELQLSDRAGSQGIDRAYSVMELLAAHMTRNIAKTLVRSTFLLAHETMRRTFPYELSVKHEGRWLSSTPSEWQPRDEVFIKVGMSPGERTRRVAMFEQMMNNQIALAQQGMEEVLVNVEGFYATMMDWARAGDIPNPERYWVDPQSDVAKQAMKSKADAAQEQKAMQEELMSQAVALEQMRTAFEKYRTDVEMQFKYYEANLKAEVEEAKIVGSATTQLLASGQKENGSNKEPNTKEVKENEESAESA